MTSTDPSQTARILIVDDTPLNLQSLSGVLKAEGHQISVALNGAQALQVMRKVRPDLVLLDVLMPEMDGYEACARIRAVPEWQDIPVIFLTGKTEAADIVRGFEVGAVDYVAKPFNAHELVARVRTHLTLARLNRENERLLLNVLPAAIVQTLRKQPGVIANRLDDVSVLFADIVNFTPLSSRLSATDVVGVLNDIFTQFDTLVDASGLEKIKTIGDAYMVAGGLPAPSPDHLERMVRLALAMQDTLKAQTGGAAGLELRIGIHTGSVVAGVIGRHRFSYDIWGDTVNTASRVESHGVPGRVQVSEPVYTRIRDWCPCEPRGLVDVKGKGPTPLYLLAPV